MRTTTQLLGDYEELERSWNIFYRRCSNSPVLPLMGEEWLREFHDTVGSVGIFLEDTQEMLKKADEDLELADQERAILDHSEAEFERKMEEGIVKAETSFEPDAHTYTPGDEV